jgi:hypothetical protein
MLQWLIAGTACPADSDSLTAATTGARVRLSVDFLAPREDFVAQPSSDVEGAVVGNSVQTPSRDVDRQWFILGRWQEYEGEARANLLRISGIAAFYLVELVNYHGLRLGLFEMPQVVERPFHQAVTALALAWLVVALAVQLCLSQRVFPSQLKFLSTLGDVVLLTGTLTVANGPRSPLVAVYFVVIALAALRLNLPLVRFATVGSMAGYVFLLGYARWFTDRDLRVPRYHQIILLLALALTGIVLGQVIRRVHKLAKDYAARVESNKGRAS